MAITVNLDPPSAQDVDELDHALAELRHRGHTPRRSGEGWIARCVTHEDASASLSLARGNKGGLVTHCHAGCTREAIWAELGIPDRKPAGTQPLQTAPTPTARRIVATYPYTDEQGELLYEALRYEPKTFRQRRPDGNGGWIYSLGETRRVLYRLQLVITTAKAGGVIYIAEGEKDVGALERAGAVATCSPMGAGKWLEEFSQALLGASAVIIIADNDKPGIKHAQDIASSLLELGIPHAIKYAVIGKDAHDHLAAGYTLDQLEDYEPGDDGEPIPALVELFAEPSLLGARQHVRLLDLDHILKHPPPDPEYAWGNKQEGYLEIGTLCVLHGDGGLGKSLIGQGLCRRYTLAKEWLGQSTPGGIALYLDGENSEAEIARRLHAFQFRPGDHALHYGRVDMPILLDATAGEALLEELILETRATLIVLDSQRALWGGDEREQLEVRPMYAMLARIAERLQVAILLIHHDNKSGIYSGSTDINAAVVSRIHLERREAKKKKDRRRVLYHEKSRSGPEVDPVTFTVHKGHEGVLEFTIHDENEDEQATESYRVPRDTTRQRILGLLFDRVPRKRYEVARELGFDATNGTLRRAWDELINDGSITPTAHDTYTLA